MILLISSSTLPAISAESTTPSEFERRNDYLQAREQLRLGRLSDFRKIASRLDSYPLRPYLDYYELRRRLTTAKVREVLSFSAANADIPATELLYKRWLKVLGKKRQWQTLRDHYRPTTDAEIRCYHLRALYGTGAKEQALDETTAMWLQPVSQPKACDPLFEVWRQTSRFSEDIVWQRFDASIMANERTLARYLIRFLSGSNKTAADAFYAVHVSPARVARTSRYRTDTPKYRTLIMHGLSRLATRDITKANRAWRGYRKSHSFDARAVQRMDGIIAVNQATAGQFPPTEERASFVKPSLIEEFATAAVEVQNWREAIYWIDQLPDEIKQKSQWRYWLGRALSEDKDNTGLADEVYATLAKQRHYYGFLAARQLGLPGRMNGVVNHVSNIDIARIQRIPGVARSIELFAVGDDLNGRREWFKALGAMRADQQLSAAQLAQQLGLISMSIRTANIAEASDHLQLRFPVVYEPQFRRASSQTSLAMPFLIAIARQESALEASARSSADARGLMQLLPSTSVIVARRARKTRPSDAALYDPGTNIALGSYHIAWLMTRYDHQSPLAIAAYNAGEHRVDRWIKEADGMPMDVWIERIPFNETRNYVKNVLAFRHVYGNRLGIPAPMLGVNERVVRTP